MHRVLALSRSSVRDCALERNRQKTRFPLLDPPPKRTGSLKSWYLRAFKPSAAPSSKREGRGTHASPRAAFSRADKASYAARSSCSACESSFVVVLVLMLCFGRRGERRSRARSASRSSPTFSPASDAPAHFALGEKTRERTETSKRRARESRGKRQKREDSARGRKEGKLELRFFLRCMCGLYESGRRRDRRRVSSDAVRRRGENDGGKARRVRKMEGGRGETSERNEERGRI